MNYTIKSQTASAIRRDPIVSCVFSTALGETKFKQWPTLFKRLSPAAQHEYHTKHNVFMRKLLDRYPSLRWYTSDIYTMTYVDEKKYGSLYRFSVLRTQQAVTIDC